MSLSVSILYHFSRTKLEQQQSLQDELESEKQQVSKMREKLQNSTAELQSIRSLEKQLNHEIEKYRHNVEDLKDQLRDVKYTAEKTVDASQVQLDQHKLNWLDEKQRLQSRMDELEKQVANAQKKVEEQVQFTKKVSTFVTNFC